MGNKNVHFFEKITSSSNKPDREQQVEPATMANLVRWNKSQQQTRLA
jgi:hypothetical protein